MNEELQALWQELLELAEKVRTIECNNACHSCPFAQDVGEWYGGGTFDVCDVLRQYIHH